MLVAGEIPFWWMTIRLRMDPAFWLSVLEQLPPKAAREPTQPSKDMLVKAIEAVEADRTTALTAAKTLRQEAAGLVQRARELENDATYWRRKRQRARG